MCIIILLTGGFTVFTKGNWDSATFVSSYLDIPLVLTAFLFWKFYKRTKFVSLQSVPIAEALEQVSQYEEVPETKSSKWLVWISWLWD